MTAYAMLGLCLLAAAWLFSLPPRGSTSLCTAAWPLAGCALAYAFC